MKVIKKVETNEEKIFCRLLPLIHWMISGILAMKMFSNIKYNESYHQMSNRIGIFGKVCTAFIIFLCAGVIIFLLYHGIYNILYVKTSDARKIFLRTVPYMVLMTGFLFTNLYEMNKTGGGYVGDVGLTWNMGMRFFPFVFVYLSGVYTLCFFIIPVWIAPSIIKIIFESLVVGYIIFRCEKYYRTKWAYVLYLVFLLQPVKDFGVQIHRMHWYAFLYLFAAIKLFFDEKESGNRNRYTILIMSIILGLLSVWRREGIYLLVFGSLFLIVAYHKRNEWKKMILCYLVVLLIVWTPRLLYEGQDTLGDSFIVWQAYIVHMLADETFEREKYKQELQAIDRLLELEKIDLFNSEKGDTGFGDAYWAWPDYEEGQYYAIREGVDENIRAEFKRTVFCLVMEEPFIFIKSRLRAFCYVAAQNNHYNLFIPFIICFVILLYCLYKKETLLFLFFLGVIGHSILTILCMPASYFKYFFQMYLCAYTFAGIILIAENKNCKQDGYE